jgi:hypothetical protein
MPASICGPVIDKYLRTLKSDFAIIQADDGCRLVTPYYRPDGDAIEVVLKDLGNGQLRLTDAGGTFDYLFLSGLNLDRNKDLYDEALRITSRRGALLDNSEIYLETKPELEGDALARLISAIESVTYLIYRRQHRELNPFSEEVAEYLSSNQVEIEESYELPGKITPVHTVTIYINSSKNIVVEPLSAISKAAARRKAEHLYYEVNDMHSVTPNIRFTGIIDDRDEERTEVWSDTRAKSITTAIFTRVFSWGKREQLLSFARQQ